MKFLSVRFLLLFFLVIVVCFFFVIAFLLGVTLLLSIFACKRFMPPFLSMKMYKPTCFRPFTFLVVYLLHLLYIGTNLKYIKVVNSI